MPSTALSTRMRTTLSILPLMGLTSTSGLKSWLLCVQKASRRQAEEQEVAFSGAQAEAASLS